MSLAHLFFILFSLFYMRSIFFHIYSIFFLFRVRFLIFFNQFATRDHMTAMHFLIAPFWRLVT